MNASWMLIGFGGGVAVAALAAWVISKRQLAMVRDAERRAQAAERMAEIGAMTGGLAHEIKNPLSTLALNAGLLTESIQDLEIPDAERTRLLNRMRGMRRETERLSDILKDFLEYAGKIHLEPHDANLNTVLEELVDFYSPEAERHGVRLRHEPSPSPISARIDVRLFKQALLNLMMNATQAMSAADTSQPADRARELILRLQRSKDHAGRPLAQVHIIDTGPGMNPETLDKIFNPYFTTKPGGSGLGLPMTRRYIEAHRGRIDVHSEPGRGTDFTISVPIEPPHLAPGA